ncbi:MAG: hypothetical protein KDA87_21210, partial [Planctomycetales bacterium]|nr:hypothetical protein [Planctomycetales bacterium]
GRTVCSIEYDPRRQETVTSSRRPRNPAVASNRGYPLTNDQRVDGVGNQGDQLPHEGDRNVLEQAIGSRSDLADPSRIVMRR